MVNSEIEELIGTPKKRKRNVRSKGTSHKNELFQLLTSRLAKRPYFINKHTGELRTTRFAGMIQLTPEAVYLWLRSDQITIRGVNRVIKAFPTIFRMKDFLPFLSDEDYDSIPTRDFPIHVRGEINNLV